MKNANSLATLIFLALAACEPSEKDVLSIVREMDVNGTRLAYADQGKGQPVVFVHGAIADLRIWEAQRKSIAEKFRFIAVTQRYFGTEPWPDQEQPLTATTRVDDLAAFIQGLKAGPVHLVGWSYSGHIVLATAAAHPELVKSVFVYETGGGDGVNGSEDLKNFQADAAAFFTAIGKALTRSDDQAVKSLIDDANQAVGAFESFPPAIRAVWLENGRTLRLAEPPSTPLSCNQLADIKVPAAIVRGELARPLFKISTDAAAACMSKARNIVIPGARHLWPVQDSAAFNSMLLRFLRDQER